MPNFHSHKEVNAFTQAFQSSFQRDLSSPTATKAKHSIKQGNFVHIEYIPESRINQRLFIAQHVACHNAKKCDYHHIHCFD
jgi:hypothetical protein